MPALSNAALSKLSGHAVVTRVHEDAKAGLVLFIDESKRAHLAVGQTLDVGVSLSTQRRDSIHYSVPLFEVEVSEWLRDEKAVDARAMAWTKSGNLYREAIRYGRQVLVVWGGNNARNLQSVGLTFEQVDAAKRFYSSFTERLPKGFIDTGVTYVPGRGGVAREYWPPKKQTGKKVVKALGRVVDESVRWVLDFSGANFKEDVATYPTEADAIAAFNRKELEWYRAGGRPYEIEWMKSIKRRADSTIVDYLDEQLQHEEKQAAFVQKVLLAAKLPVPTQLPATIDHGLLDAVRAIPDAHWLLVGQQRAKQTIRHDVMNKRGVSVHFDREHLAVAVLTQVEGRRSWATVKRASDVKKAEALWAATMKRFKLG